MWKLKQILLLRLLCQLLVGKSSAETTTPISEANVFDPRVALTVAPTTRDMVLNWNHSNLKRGDRIVVTSEDFKGDKFDKYEIAQPLSESETGSGEGSGAYSLDKFLGIFPEPDDGNRTEVKSQKLFTWRFGEKQKEVVYSMIIPEPSGWWRTHLKYNLRWTGHLTINSSCYAFFVYLIDENGTIINRNCLKAHPRWMNELRTTIENIKFRNLFIPGTHDSGSYKLGIDIFTDNTILNKYSITQDDDIRSQLMHGIRYLDLRIGYYRNNNEKFWINHGISKFQPLSTVLQAVKDFVRETNEIVIIDFQEFPIGFGQDKTIHRSLAHLIYESMKDVLVPPTGSWDVSLRDIWNTGYNVIIGYDKPGIQFEFRDFLWESVEHRWADAQNVSSLIRYLKRSRDHSSLNYRLRPVAEMGELTPKTLGILTDLYGGLRKMAENSNRHISELYSSEFGLDANVVAIDFHLSTTIIDTAIKINSLKRSGNARK